MDGHEEGWNAIDALKTKSVKICFLQVMILDVFLGGFFCLGW
jgi:hypothetical protein